MAGRRAVLVMDLVRDVCDPAGRFGHQGVAARADGLGLPDRVSRVIAHARNSGDVVAWVAAGPKLFEKVDLDPASPWGAEFDDRYGTPQPGEAVFEKSAVGAFRTTNLASHLRGLGVDRVMLMGIATSHVVKASAIEAIERGFEVDVLVDCCCDLTDEDHDQALAELPSEVRLLRIDAARVGIPTSRPPAR